MAFTDSDKKRVQHKWNIYMELMTEFRESDVGDPSALKMLEDIGQAKQDLWLEVAKVTKDINPHMEADVLRGGYSHCVSYLRHHFDVEV